MRRNFDVKRLKKVVHGVITFYKNIQVAVETIHYLYSPTKKYFFLFPVLQDQKTKQELFFLNKKMPLNIFLARVLQKTPGVWKYFIFNPFFHIHSWSVVYTINL